MSVIVPAILPTSREDLFDKVARLRGLATEVQIDAIDGRFSKPACWPYTENATLAEVLRDGLPHPDQILYDIDLMTTAPEEAIRTWVDAGARRITLHAESTPYLPKVLSEMETLFGHDKDFAPNLLSLGIALNIQSELALIEPFLPHVDYVQFMGIKRIGRQGEGFDPAVVTKIRAFRKLHPKITIQVDGGVSAHTAPELMRAGVDRLIVGSALWKAPDLHEAYRDMVRLAQEYGLYE